MELKKEYYEHLIPLALKEDLLETGDVTSDAIFDDEEAVFTLLSKDTGILCGKQIYEAVFHYLDKNIKVDFYFEEKASLKPGEIVARVTGNVLTILKGERTALNFLSHLSGIASKTAHFVQAAQGKIKILDTRKTLPVYRMLHKYAVHCGGGHNHRIGLYDMVMIKDNHIDACGSITEAVKRVRDKWQNKYQIEVETRNIKEVEEALEAGADQIMLDNMTMDLMKESVKIIGERAKTEISGNVTLERIKDLKETGADFVSIGELTHTIKVFDFSLKKEKK